MNTWSSIFLQKCPRCRKGDMFKYPLSQFWKFNQMHKQCSHCHCELIPEPGFYIGAMYLSYGVNVGVVLGVFFTLRIAFPDASVLFYLSIVLPAIVLMFPFNFRVSRSLMLHWFGGITYEGKD